MAIPPVEFRRAFSASVRRADTARLDRDIAGPNCNTVAANAGGNELGQQTRARSLSRIPLGRLGEVEDLVGMAIYLLSPAPDFCTGQVMYVDGGYTAG